MNNWLSEHGFLVIRDSTSLVPISRSPDFLGPNTSSLNTGDYRLNASQSSSRRASGASVSSSIATPLSPGDKTQDFSSPVDEESVGKSNVSHYLRQTALGGKVKRALMSFRDFHGV